MKLSARIAAPVAALVLAGPHRHRLRPADLRHQRRGRTRRAAPCASGSSRRSATSPRRRSSTRAVADFEKAHEGAEVEVEYIPVDTRAQRIKAAFNDPKSAPDLIEYGNTDTAGYVKDGGLADVSKEFAAWDEAKDTDPTAKQSVTVDGKVYGAPLFVGVRALYYRTDVFDELGIEPPKSQDELISTARKIREEKPDLYGLAVGGAYTYGAMPFIWAHGGELADETGGDLHRRPSTARRPGRASRRTPRSSATTTARPPSARPWAATRPSPPSPSGKAAMAIGGDFSHAGGRGGRRQGQVRRRAAARREEGRRSPRRSPAATTSACSRAVRTAPSRST